LVEVAAETTSEKQKRSLALTRRVAAMISAFTYAPNANLSALHGEMVYAQACEADGRQ
jgi:calcineurin-like phosphoesterase